jgi:PAS domain S-box-containing protein
LVTATAQIVWTTNPVGEVVNDMPTWRAFTGMSLQQILGRGWIDALHPSDRQQTAEVWSKAVREKKLYDTQYRMLRHDGDYRTVAVRGVPVKEIDGTIREWIGTCTDITERARAEAEIRSLNNELEDRVQRRTAQLEAANKELEAFTYSVSHDLRAPLRHISGFSKILTEEFGPQLSAEARHHLQRIEEGTHRMGLLVDDLLNLARVGRRDLSLQVTGLKSVVEEVINGLKPDVGERQVEWKIGDLPYVECDTALIKQVFQNLLANSLKFTRPRARTIIEVAQEQKDGAAVVYVRDNGVGFSMKYADKLFGVFQRLHRPEDFEGTGVGLATVQRIIQKHGGRIWAEAELDKGATFYFTISNIENNELKAKAAVVGDKI